ncbi:hypothetical protein BGZ80_001258 [Entomortierella chlamydospora]|uniref:Uncharacterized protein n=1 Tax=Entomortierella chlamydospora TaxID=101097 RepID=A0A9P6SYF6_9FUNG|nr:hypothetical protein BGZ80_001258 [Entomortierella chlamydospora]
MDEPAYATPAQDLIALDTIQQQPQPMDLFIDEEVVAFESYYHSNLRLNEEFSSLAEPTSDLGRTESFQDDYDWSLALQTSILAQTSSPVDAIAEQPSSLPSLEPLDDNCLAFIQGIFCIDEFLRFPEPISFTVPKPKPKPTLEPMSVFQPCETFPSFPASLPSPFPSPSPSIAETRAAAAVNNAAPWSLSQGSKETAKFASPTLEQQQQQQPSPPSSPSFSFSSSSSTTNHHHHGHRGSRGHHPKGGAAAAGAMDAVVTCDTTPYKRNSISNEDKIELCRVHDIIPGFQMNLLGEIYHIGRTSVYGVIEMKETFYHLSSEHMANKRIRSQPRSSSPSPSPSSSLVLSLPSPQGLSPSPFRRKDGRQMVSSIVSELRGQQQETELSMAEFESFQADFKQTLLYIANDMKQYRQEQQQALESNKRRKLRPAGCIIRNFAEKWVAKNP